MIFLNRMCGKHKIKIFIIATLFLFSYGAHRAQAAIKDTDVDGLSDEAETSRYHTNPLVFDTDGDGRGDGDEILDGTDPLDGQSSVLATLSKPDPGLLGNPEKFTWYLGRASGILAFILLSSVVIFGLVISSRAFGNFVPGALAYEAHRFVAWLALGTVILHFSSFFFDNFLKLSIVEALVPFVLVRDMKTVAGFNLGKAAALGIVAFYGILILIFTSEWRAKMSLKVWRSIHYTSFATYVLFLAHGFTAGTDSREWWMRALYAASLSVVLLMILIRIISRNIVPAWRNLRARKTA